MLREETKSKLLMRFVLCRKRQPHREDQRVGLCEAATLEEEDRRYGKRQPSKRKTSDMECGNPLADRETVLSFCGEMAATHEGEDQPCEQKNLDCIFF